MADRTCPKCNMVYEFPSGLKKHLQRSFHCLTSNDNIETYMNNNRRNTNTNTIANTTLQCNKCSKCFSYKHTLDRHINNTKCGKSQATSATSATINILLPKYITGTVLNQMVKAEMAKLMTEKTISNFISKLPNEKQIKIAQSILRRLT